MAASLYGLDKRADEADYFAAGSLDRREEAESVALISRRVFAEPRADLILGEAMFPGVHHLRVAKYP